MTNKAWGIFAIDQSGKAEMIECYEAVFGFTLKDAKEYVEESRDEEMETYGNTLELRPGHMVDGVFTED